MSDIRGARDTGAGESAELLPVLALGILLVITVAWWALALWPVDGPPEWLLRTRAVCFNAGDDGLPDASGWMLLVGQPLGMMAVLWVAWRDGVHAGLRSLARSRGGRLVLGAGVLVILTGAAAAGARVSGAGAAEAELPPGAVPPESYPRLDREPGHLGLVDQRGRTVTLEGLRGRPVLLTFAFGHCASICPLVVDGALRARREAAGEMEVAVVVVTLDPWRDTPARLPALAERWGMDEGTHLLSGEIGAVEAVLDAWNVARERDPLSGDVAHPPLVYVLDREGRIAFASTGRPAELGVLLGRL